MRSAERFLLAAKRCEIVSLEQLALTCELVSVVSELVHQLQRERGVSNVFLVSDGLRFSDRRLLQIKDTDAAVLVVRQHFERLDCDTANFSCGGVRLFNRIAWVLHGLDLLQDLRQQTAAFKVSPDDATTAFSRLIGGLLAVVFEAADTAADPVVTRLLVAMFNFMQGKELAGQERACLASGFASGYLSLDQQHRLQHLIESQARCFDIFTEFAPAPILQDWHQLCHDDVSQEIARLRQVATRSTAQSPVPSGVSELWFELASNRIDAMKGIDDQLAQALRHLCTDKIEAARKDLQEHQQSLDGLTRGQDQMLSPGTLMLAPTGAGLESLAAGLESFSADGMSPALGRSVFDLVQAQAQRLQAIGDELNEARRALHERKLIERAKGLLMEHQGLSEEQAYRLMRQTAMQQSRRLADVAETLLNLTDLLQSKSYATKAE
ncbi:nitrate regulatory protein [Nitrincola alkalilacustris]|uniref:nitrate regulatory protein n=1 Tax=Nitrincola alkalilacustris TaxID=1571224 RepID=UPI00124C342E|nr:nitrate regulatory protein [Nitrincola alkalilacustris]